MGKILALIASTFMTEVAQKDEVWSLKEEALQPGSPEQFVKAYDHYAPLIYRHAVSRVGNRETAEDIASQVFLKAWEYLETAARPVENVRAFLFHISHNLICDHYRKRKFETVAFDALTERHAPQTPEKSSHVFVEEREIILEVEQTLALLDEAYRDVLVWRYVEELSIEEISSISGKSPNVIYVTLHRALKKLRVLLAEKEL